MALDDRSSMDLLRGSRITAYVVGLLSLGAGVVLLVWPDRTITVVARLIGILVLVIGLGEAIEAATTHRKGSYWGLLLLRGLIDIAFGALLLFWPGVTITVVVWLLGLDLVLSAVLGLIVSTRVPKEYGRDMLIVRSVVGAAIGIAIMVWPDATLSVLAVLAAVVLILVGLILLFSGYQLSKAQVTVSDV